MSTLREILSDEQDKLSSTRILGTIGWAVGLVLACLGMVQASSTVLTASGVVLGAGQFKSALASKAKTTSAVVAKNQTSEADK